MKERHLKIVAIFFTTALLLSWMPVSADLAPVVNYVASSTNYRLGEDSINSGGVISTSTSYITSDVLPVFVGDNSTSTSFNSSQTAPLLGNSTLASATISISTPSNVTMSPAINTSGGGTGNGSASWNVTTDSSGGYSLSINSSTVPALKSATDSFPNYSTQVANIPDFDPRVGAAAEFFGFTPEGSDITSLYKDDGVSLCNTGTNDTTDKCWNSIDTIDKVFATGTGPNTPSGTATTVKFRAFAGTLIHKAAGSYSATITVTALSL